MFRYSVVVWLATLSAFSVADCYNVTITIQPYEVDGSNWETLAPWDDPDVKFCVQSGKSNDCRVDVSRRNREKALCEGLVCVFEDVIVRSGDRITLVDLDTTTPDDWIGQGECRPPASCRVGSADAEFEPSEGCYRRGPERPPEGGEGP